MLILQLPSQFLKVSGAPTAATCRGNLDLPFSPSVLSAEQSTLSDLWVTFMSQAHQVTRPQSLSDAADIVLRGVGDGHLRGLFLKSSCYLFCVESCECTEVSL